MGIRCNNTRYRFELSITNILLYLTYFHQTRSSIVFEIIWNSSISCLCYVLITTFGSAVIWDHALEIWNCLLHRTCDDQGVWIWGTKWSTPRYSRLHVPQLEGIARGKLGKIKYLLCYGYITITFQKVIIQIRRWKFKKINQKSNWEIAWTTSITIEITIRF